MTASSKTQWSLLAVSLLTSGFLLGCPGGGAKEESKVVMKPSQGPATTDEENGENTTNNQTENPSVTLGGVGTLKGRVVFQGTPPTLKPLYSAGANIKDAAVCAAEPIPDERLVVGTDNGVANVFIYLGRAPSGAPKSAPSGEPPVFDQKGCVYTPHVLFVQTGAPLTVTSSDPVPHNVHTLPKRNSQENAVVNQGAQMTIKYPRAEVQPFEVKCDYHAWMIAYHMTLDHPYCAVTDENGNFEIPNLPAGKHKFLVWHESTVGTFLHQNYEITVAGGDQTTTVDIPYPESSLKDLSN